MAFTAESSALQERALENLREHPEVTGPLKCWPSGQAPFGDFSGPLAQGLKAEQLLENAAGSVDVINRLLVAKRLYVIQTADDNLTYHYLAAEEVQR